MKKVLLGVGVCAVAGYLGTVYLVDRFDQRLSAEHLAQASLQGVDELGARAFRVINENGCQYCHTQGSELPFYAGLPVAKQLMAHDITQARRHFSIAGVLDDIQQKKPVSEVALAKIESVIADNRMPPNLYLGMHWRSHLSDEERQILLDWVKAERLRQHPDSAASEPFRNDPVQPVTRHFPVSATKVELGKRLYHDTRLSGDNTLSCASCHPLDQAGVDHKKVSTGINGAQGPINAPTVFNAAFNIHQFWDGRAADLQEQAGGPPLNPIEMGSTSWAQIIGKLDQDADLNAEFMAIYPAGITASTITDAIAEFEKTLVTPDSRFDRYLKGDDSALDDKEKAGYALFKAQQCATCHVGESMGGQSFEVMGLKKDYFAARGAVKEVDHGRFNVTKDPNDMYRFKVPNLRNVALTAPYFHDASAATLEEAVEQMGLYEVGVQLSADEIDKISAFLKTLNGQYQGRIMDVSP